MTLHYHNWTLFKQVEHCHIKDEPFYMLSLQWDQFHGGQWSFSHSEKGSCLVPVNTNIIGGKIISQKKNAEYSAYFCNIFLHQQKDKRLRQMNSGDF